MAVRTADRVTLPDEQAEPALTATPARSSAMTCVSAVTPGMEMQVVYHLYSVLTPDWLRVIAEGLPRDTPRVPSVTFLWTGAEWAEREAYDMFGIEFEGHPDLVRILMPDDWVGYPLRKDDAPSRVPVTFKGDPSPR